MLQEKNEKEIREKDEEIISLKVKLNYIHMFNFVKKSWECSFNKYIPSLFSHLVSLWNHELHPLSFFYSHFHNWIYIHKRSMLLCLSHLFVSNFVSGVRLMANRKWSVYYVVRSQCVTDKILILDEVTNAKKRIQKIRVNIDWWKPRRT